MADLNGFNANNVEPNADFDPIPAGKYLAIITASEMKPTKNNNGHFLELTFQVIDGQYKNRLLWSRLNLDNPSDQAVQIARGELSALCRAIGVMQPRDSIELHNLPLMVTVKCKNREDTGDVVNEIKGYAKKEPVAATPSAQINTPPWARK
ncbi:MAG: DUF669 domain-containing protein [Deltaproteobacteria bacterium]|nr:DUF669 domain-containing protein [Deltaproteobacteria bacterium]